MPTSRVPFRFDEEPLNVRRRWGQIALAVMYALLALNAWAQVIFVPLGRSGDPRILTALQVLVGIASTAAAWGSWAGTKWSPWAVVLHGVITAAMLVSLGAILDLGPDALGPQIGGVAVLLWDLGFAWYLYRLTNGPADTSDRHTV